MDAASVVRKPNRNRNCGFYLKTEPKPTDLSQYETVTTLHNTQYMLLKSYLY